MGEMQKDLVLDSTSYAYVLDTTKGNISCWVGPTKTSLSTSDQLVVFNEKTKKFEPARYDEAIKLFTTAPEGWYVALKNPEYDGKHPQRGAANSLPERMDIGKKINIPGPVSFALYPGQMAKVIKGHTLKSNQYLLARVYDEYKANYNNGSDINACESESERKTEKTKRNKYVNGQTLVIKGTDISFYIPPTGIEVIPARRDEYVREAVSLEKLEYCILKDEDGTKRYVHGPAVVFPEATEKFLLSDDGKSVKYKAIELSEISGVYIKVITDYEENGVQYKTGQELFITGKEQMIYYPRPEHTFISYGNTIKHHAIAIPKGEGRYIMNRKTGDIKTIVGPAMYLPDPREEVVVKRTLSKKQCNLWYPNNNEVLFANGYGNKVQTDNYAMSAGEALKSLSDALNSTTLAYDYSPSSVTISTTNSLPETNNSGNVKRKNEYASPRTIDLNKSKFEGAVTLDVWTGFAVNLISKDGRRQVVRGPQTIILDYDQTLDVLQLSTGKPKTTDKLEDTVFLRYENNRISDIINVVTSDSVEVELKLSYLVNFNPDKQDKWFSIDNYVKHLCDWARATLKNYIKGVSVQELFYANTDIVKDALGLESGNAVPFEQNGMELFEAEVLAIRLPDHIYEMIQEKNEEVLEKELAKQSAEKQLVIEKEILNINKEKGLANHNYLMAKIEATAEEDRRSYEISCAQEEAEDNEAKRVLEASAELQELQDIIHAAELEREEKEREAKLEHERKLAEIEKQKLEARATAMKEVLSSIGTDLAMAMNNSNNKDVVEAIAKAVSPYAIANNEGVSDAINKLVRGTALEDVIAGVMNK